MQLAQNHDKQYQDDNFLKVFSFELIFQFPAVIFFVITRGNWKPTLAWPMIRYQISQNRFQLRPERPVVWFELHLKSLTDMQFCQYALMRIGDFFEHLRTVRHENYAELRLEYLPNQYYDGNARSNNNPYSGFNSKYPIDWREAVFWLAQNVETLFGK